MNLKNFFNPKSIAIVGASEAEGKVGNVVAKNVLKLGYAGKVFLVNPGHEKMFGQKCFPDLESISEKVDLAVVVVPAKFVFEVVRKASDKVKNFVVISAGFSETGKEGHEREEALLKLAEEKDLNILGPNCLGFIVPSLNLNASFAGGMPEGDGIAIVSQSGALVVALMDIAKKEQMGFSHLISVGNKMQLDESDLIEYLMEDKKVKVIGLYLEGIKDGQKFMEAAAKASGKKPIVIIKAGKTERAQKAISSHTGALAGSDAVVGKAFERLGIVRADNLENFIDLLKFISLSKAPKKNKKVAIITNAGGPGVLTTDSFLGKEIELAEISEKGKKALRQFLPEEASVENPIDLLGDAREDRYQKALEVLEKEDIGSILAVLTPQDQTPVDKIAQTIAEFRKKTKKGVATVFIGGERIRRALGIFRLNAINNFAYPNQAVSALNKYFQWSQLNKEKIKLTTLKISKSRAVKAQAIIQGAKISGRKALFFDEAQRVMELYGINCIPFQNMTNASENRIGFPVVLKVDSDKLLHKADKQGIILNIQNQEKLNLALRKMSSNFWGERLIIQSMAEIKTEIIVGFKRDPIFGPVILFGLGGIYAEIFKVTNLLVGPMTESEILIEIEKSQIAYLFEGARGQKPYNKKELVKILSGLMSLGAECPEISELDINPLLVYNDEKKAVAVDVKILI
jgi:acetyltransferase